MKYTKKNRNGNKNYKKGTKKRMFKGGDNDEQVAEEEKVVPDVIPEVTEEEKVVPDVIPEVAEEEKVVPDVIPEVTEEEKVVPDVTPQVEEVTPEEIKQETLVSQDAVEQPNPAVEQPNPKVEEQTPEIILKNLETSINSITNEQNKQTLLKAYNLIRGLPLDDELKPLVQKLQTKIENLKEKLNTTSLTIPDEIKQAESQIEEAEKDGMKELQQKEPSLFPLGNSDKSKSEVPTAYSNPVPISADASLDNNAVPINSVPINPVPINSAPINSDSTSAPFVQGTPQENDEMVTLQIPKKAFEQVQSCIKKALNCDFVKIDVDNISETAKPNEPMTMSPQPFSSENAQVAQAAPTTVVPAGYTLVNKEQIPPNLQQVPSLQPIPNLQPDKSF